MSFSRLDHLFQNEEFRRDLARVVDLPADTLRKVVEFLSVGRPLSEFPEVMGEAEINREAITDALAFFTIVADTFQSENLPVGEVVDRVASVVGRTAGNLREFEAVLDELAKKSDIIASGQQRRAIIAQGGRTITSVSTVTDFRLRPKTIEFSPQFDPDKYEPEIIELLPVTTVRISFNDPDDGDDTVFQLTPTQLESFIKQFQAAQKELQKGLASVTLRKSKD